MAEGYDGIKELVVKMYESTFDLDTAMLLAESDSPDLKKTLLADESFMFRIKLADAENRMAMIEVFTGNLKSDDPRVAHKAALDLGKIVWPEKFSPNADNTKPGQVPDQIIMEGVYPK